LIFVLVGAPLPAYAGKKVALLIGNAAYKEAPLANPLNDVAAMKEVLRGAGFDTIEAHTDLDRRAMSQALDAFEAAASGAEIGLVFFSGHGIEVGGTNYLVPTDAQLKSDRDIKLETIPIGEVLQALEGATRLKLVLLDACRDNPFVARSVGRKSALGKGLGRTEATSQNMLIAYAAAPGYTALDGSGGTSPFTAALVKYLVEPGVDVRIALGKVRDEVSETTGRRQIPFQTGSLGGDLIALATSGDQANVLPPPPTKKPPQTDNQFPPQLPPPDTSSSGSYYYVTGIDESSQYPWLALRNAPTKSAPWSSTHMRNGTLLKVLDRNGEWYQVQLDSGETGWANTRYVACCKNATSVALQPVQKRSASYYYVSGIDEGSQYPWLALRNAPSKSAPWSSTHMPNGTLLKVLDRSGEWYHVQLSSGETGWANTKFVACCRQTSE